MTVQTSGSVTLEIGKDGDRRKIVLNGTVGNQIQVGFRAKDGDEEIQVGTFASIIKSVGEALGVTNFKERFEARLDELAEITPLKPVVKELRGAALYVTDLALSAEYSEENDKYEVTSAAFGFRVEFAGLELGPVKLAGFGVLFEYSPKDDTDSLQAIPG